MPVPWSCHSGGSYMSHTTWRTGPEDGPSLDNGGQETGKCRSRSHQEAAHHTCSVVPKSDLQHAGKQGRPGWALRDRRALWGGWQCTPKGRQLPKEAGAGGLQKVMR